MDTLVSQLRAWFLQVKRPLPWREERSPYRVWVSEVMLQQTQAAAVIPYFLRWMQRFPTLETLAAASEEEVVLQWEGLGYYSRARNLWQGAKKVVNHYGGVFPSTKEELNKIPGLGPYTVGAILSFAFQQREAAVDGNVMRVLTRFYGIESEIEKTATQKQVRALAKELLPKKRPFEVAEAFIELGALICKKSPLCEQCPLKRGCVAFRDRLQEALPKRKKRASVTKLFREVAVVVCDNALLVERREGKGVMKGLFELPFYEQKASLNTNEKIVKAFEKQLNLSLCYQEPLPLQKHGFTRYQAHLFPHLLAATQQTGEGWVPINQLDNLPFSSGHRRIVKTLKDTL